MDQIVILKKANSALISPDFIIWLVTRMALLGVLVGCATAPVPEASIYSRAALEPLSTLEPWSLEGRLALTGVSDSWQADINWDHQPSMEQIKLSGPMGQGAVAIRLTKDFVTLARGSSELESSDQPEEFINQQLGLFVPVRSLRYWVLGLPRPDQAFEDSPGGFKQEGWQIDYPQMQTVYGKIMPRKIIVKNDQVKLKLFIDQWIINGNDAQ